MIPPFFPWFLAFLLLIACVALLVLLLRYRDRSVRLEAESRSWQERAEDRTQMLPRAQKLKNLGVTSTKELPRALEDITEQAKSADVPDIPS